MKKILALFLCAMLVLSQLPAIARAETCDTSSEEAVKAEIARVYSKCLEASGYESFAGYCGLLATYQLWFLGINKELGPTYNGNQQFDAYRNTSVTSGGYHPKAYPADQYTLDQALNAITRGGTQDADNILVSFESTNTEAGSIYGHSMVIHTIMDGKVYFVENYNTFAGPEGSVIVLTIPEFVSFYESWTVLDGVVHFGDRRYSDRCQTFATDVFVRTRFGSTLRSEPCLLTENECTRQRTLSTGELLHATAVLRNPRGERYYQIEEGDRIGYVAANAVSVVQISDEALHCENFSLPGIAALDEDLELGGKVVADSASISAIRLTVTNDAGKTMLDAQLDATGGTADLSLLNEQLEFQSLKAGEYTVTVYATAACVAVKGSGLITLYAQTPIYEQPLAVGQLGAVQSREIKATPRDGWFLRNGTWCYYKFHNPCSGWITYLGVDYYLQKDGSVTTGLQEVDGWMRYFSATGALCSGWVTIEDGSLYYWTEDGLPANGWLEIEGQFYCFEDTGKMMTEGIVTRDGISYEIQPDGTSIEF